MDRPKCIICGEPVERNGKYWRATCHKCRVKKNPYPGGLAARQAKKYGMDLTRCEICEWNGLCDAHHKDRDKNNSSLLNLQVLCPNCHRSTHHPIKHPQIK